MLLPSNSKWPYFSFKMLHFLSLNIFLGSIANKIWVYDPRKSLHSVFYLHFIQRATISGSELNFAADRKVKKC